MDVDKESKQSDKAPITLAELSMNLSARAVCGILLGTLIWILIAVLVGLCLKLLVGLIPGLESLASEKWVAGVVGLGSRILLVVWLTGWLVFSLRSLFSALVMLTRSFWQPESRRQRWYALAIHVIVWPLTLYQAMLVVMCLAGLISGEEMGS